MIDLFEKIAAGACGLVVLCVGLAYVVLGIRSPTPIEFVEEVRPIVVSGSSSESGTAAATSGGRPALAKAMKDIRSVDDQELRKKLQAQGHNATRLRRAELEKRAMPIPPATFEVAQTEANWLRELKKYRSAIQSNPDGRPTLLRVEGIEENTMLKKLGLHDGDVVELLDGEIVEFEEGASLRYRSMFRDALERLRQGESISVTVRRDGKPVHLTYFLDR